MGDGIFFKDDIKRIRKIIKKARDYNLQNLRSGVMEGFLWELILLINKEGDDGED